ncbi:MAG: hypothetical protein IKL84_04995 [Clostridia bacterium]|nr:hypothetical protein [Clostridia bacterium]
MNNPNIPGTGFLVVRVGTANGAIPLPDATVVIRANGEGKNDVLYTQRTDRSGLTERIPLPAPAAANSSAPGEAPFFSTYNIEVSHPGYYTNTYQNVPIFDRITALQPVELIPLSRNGREENSTPNDTRFYESTDHDL